MSIQKMDDYIGRGVIWTFLPFPLSLSLSSLTTKDEKRRSNSNTIKQMRCFPEMSLYQSLLSPSYTFTPHVVSAYYNIMQILTIYLQNSLITPSKLRCHQEPHRGQCRRCGLANYNMACPATRRIEIAKFMTRTRTRTFSQIPSQPSPSKINQITQVIGHRKHTCKHSQMA